MRQLTEQDFEALQAMETGIEDDYVVRIFNDLIQRENNVMYGLFDQNQMIAVSGYTLFSNKFAMLGRLRTDIRYRGKGYGTYILQSIIDQLYKNPSIQFVSANTQLHNASARRALEKLELPFVTMLQPLIIQNPEIIKGESGPIWEKVETISDKRTYIVSMKDHALGAFPYEAYYPLPFDESYLTDDYLHAGTMYINPSKTRFLFCKIDQKGNRYLNTKYFWNDQFDQAGLWETIQHEYQLHEDVYGVWMDVSTEVAASLHPSEDFELPDPWLLYGKPL